MYKDKDKQREANRQAKARQRAGMTQGMTSEGMTGKGMTSKRGKDIQCFEDLPPDVRRTIVRMSTTKDGIDEQAMKIRTANAIDYQHKFPDRYESRSL